MAFFSSLPFSPKGACDGRRNWWKELISDCNQRRLQAAALDLAGASEPCWSSTPHRGGRTAATDKIQSKLVSLQLISGLI
jgi:hypothetical protein